MSGICVEKIGHSCGSRDGLQVFTQDDGTVDGFCFSCQTYVRHPYGKEVSAESLQKTLKPQKSPEEIAEEIAEIEECTSQDLPDRRLKKAALEHYGIRVGLSRVDGTTPTIVAFPYYDMDSGNLKAYKVRVLEGKKSFWVGSPENVSPFGWKQALLEDSQGRVSSTLIIVEGEFDVPAAMTIVKRHGNPNYLYPQFVSVPHGAAHAAKYIKEHLKTFQKHFKNIVLMLDDDKHGRKAVEEAYKYTGVDFDTIVLPEKDANDCLLKDKSKQAYDCITFRKEKANKSKLVWSQDIHEAAKEPPQWGLSWPWEGLTEKTRGLRFGETIYIGGGVKMGKSELLNSLAAHLIKQHGLKVLLAKPEEANSKTYKLLCGKIEGKVFHDPKVTFDGEAYERAGEVLKGKVAMLDLYQNITWDVMKAAIQDAAANGCRAVFIDPITNFTNGMASGEANVELQRIAQESSALAKDLGLMVFLFCHLKAPDGGPPHEMGGEIFSTQFAGSRAMMRSCNYMLGIQGNKSETLSPYERRLRSLKLLEDREFGETGGVVLSWDRETSLYSEVRSL